MQKCIITLYAVVVNHLLRCYLTDAVKGRVDQEIRIFKKALLTPWDFPEP